MLTKKAKLMMQKYPHIWVDTYSGSNGNIYIVRKGNSFFVIYDDGTGNGYYCKGQPELLADNVKEAIKICLENNWDIDKLLTEEELKLYDEII